MEKTILVVDFDHKSLEDIQRFFQDDKITLLTASDGARALEVFRAENPDLVLTAALLPKLNGFELCKKITGGEAGEVRPVIMFSEIYRAEKYRKEAIIGCGAVDFLEKPLIKSQLLKAIENLFSEIPSGRAVTPTRIESARPTAEIPSSMRDASIGMRDASIGQAEDILELNRLLEALSPSKSEVNLAPQQEPTPLEITVSEPEPYFMDGEEADEVEAAVDAIRMDLDLGTKVQVQKAAQAVGATFHMSKDSQDILEFEGMQVRGMENLPTQPVEAVEIVELEIPLAKPVIEQTLDLERTEALNKTANLEKAEADGIAPPTTVKHQNPRNWMPVVALLLTALLVFLFYWLWAR
jgi:DNA-binding response OmpR family regulator